MEIKLRIQSISDVITNSSSEVFLRISSTTDLHKIFELLSIALGDPYGNNDSEERVSVRLEDEPDPNICIEIPYYYPNPIFLKAGIEALLSVEDCNYTLDYANEE